MYILGEQGRKVAESGTIQDFQSQLLISVDRHLAYVIEPLFANILHNDHCIWKQNKIVVSAAIHSEFIKIPSKEFLHTCNTKVTNFGSRKIWFSQHAMSKKSTLKSCQ